MLPEEEVEAEVGRAISQAMTMSAAPLKALLRQTVTLFQRLGALEQQMSSVQNQNHDLRDSVVVLQNELADAREALARSEAAAAAAREEDQKKYLDDMEIFAHRLEDDIAAAIQKDKGRTRKRAAQVTTKPPEEPEAVADAAPAPSPAPAPAATTAAAAPAPASDVAAAELAGEALRALNEVKQLAVDAAAAAEAASDRAESAEDQAQATNIKLEQLRSSLPSGFGQEAWDGLHAQMGSQSEDIRMVRKELAGQMAAVLAESKEHVRATVAASVPSMEERRAAELKLEEAVNIAGVLHTRVGHLDEDLEAMRELMRRGDSATARARQAALILEAAALERMRFQFSSISALPREGISFVPFGDDTRRSVHALATDVGAGLQAALNSSVRDAMEERVQTATGQLVKRLRVLLPALSTRSVPPSELFEQLMGLGSFAFHYLTLIKDPSGATGSETLLDTCSFEPTTCGVPQPSLVSALRHLASCVTTALDTELMITQQDVMAEVQAQTAEATKQVKAVREETDGLPALRQTVSTINIHLAEVSAELADVAEIRASLQRMQSTTAETTRTVAAMQTDVLALQAAAEMAEEVMDRKVFTVRTLLNLKAEKDDVSTAVEKLERCETAVAEVVKQVPDTLKSVDKLTTDIRLKASKGDVRRMIEEKHAEEAEPDAGVMKAPIALTRCLSCDQYVKIVNMPPGMEPFVTEPRASTEATYVRPPPNSIPSPKKRPQSARLPNAPFSALGANLPQLAPQTPGGNQDAPEGQECSHPQVQQRVSNMHYRLKQEDRHSRSRYGQRRGDPLQDFLGITSSSSSTLGSPAGATRERPHSAPRPSGAAVLEEGSPANRKQSVPIEPWTSS